MEPERKSDQQADMQAPLQLPCGATLPNRLAKSAMSEQLGDQHNAPTEALLELYRAWSESGAGLLITGNVMIDRRARTEIDNVAVEDEQHLSMLKRWAEVAQAGGSKLWMQINHPGRQAPKAANASTVAPSAVSLEGFGPLFATPKALTEAEIQDLIERYARTAAIAKQSGFSGVQIHGAHGYLISQFLSPKTNRRDDAWGGDAERRRRFLIEVVRAVRAAVGEAFPVGLKLNSADFQRGGFSEDESLDVVRALNDEGLDLLEISGGTYERTEMWRNINKNASSSTQAREAYFLDYAEKVRALATMPILLTGGIRSVAGIQGALQSGAVDMVGMARPFLVEPRLAARFLSGDLERVEDPKLRFGLKSVDAIIQSTWYTLQMKRLSKGQSVDPKLGRLRSFFYGILKARPRSHGKRGFKAA